MFSCVTPFWYIDSLGTVENIDINELEKRQLTPAWRLNRRTFAAAFASYLEGLTKADTDAQATVWNALLFLRRQAGVPDVVGHVEELLALS